MQKKLSSFLYLTALLLIFIFNTAALANSTAKSQPSKDKQTPAEIWLDKIEKNTKKVKTLHAKVRYDRVQGLLGDTQRRWGDLVYKAGPPAKFSVHFDKLAVDDAARPQDRWYIYDGHWLAEKYGKQRIFIRHELVPKGKTKDLLALGKGPFVLPLDAHKKKILKKYHVKIIKNKRDENSKKQKLLDNTIQLRLIPKKNNKIKLTHIDLWYNRKTLWPVQAATYDKSQNISIITLTGIKLNKKIKKGKFGTYPPTEQGWDIRIKPYHKDKKTNE